MSIHPPYAGPLVAGALADAFTTTALRLTVRVIAKGLYPDQRPIHPITGTEVSSMSKPDACAFLEATVDSGATSQARMRGLLGWAAAEDANPSPKGKAGRRYGRKPGQTPAPAADPAPAQVQAQAAPDPGQAPAPAPTPAAPATPPPAVAALAAKLAALTGQAGGIYQVSVQSERPDAPAQAVTPAAGVQDLAPIPSTLDGLIQALGMGSEPPKADAYLPPEPPTRRVVLALRRSKNVLLVGPAGTGKSALVQWLAHRTGRLLRRVNLNGQTGTSDLIGKVVARNGSTEWVDGILPRAMREGSWLLLDELDFADPSILALLHPVLEVGHRTIMLKENNGEVIQAHPDFRIFGTANSLGIFDDLGLAVGTNGMNHAFLSRWSISQINYPDPAEEAQRLVCHGIPAAIAAAVAEAGKAVRHLITEAKSVAAYWGTRHSLDMAEWAMDLDDWSAAFAAASEGKMSPQEQKIAWEAVQRVVPSSAPSATGRKAQKKTA